MFQKEQLKRRFRTDGAACLLIMVLIVSLFISGCSSSGSGEEAGNEAAAEAETEGDPGSDETDQEYVSEPEPETGEESGAGDDEEDGDGAEDDFKGPACPSVNGALHVEGTQLTDSNGDPVQLRGYSTHGLAWYPEYVSQECFSDLKSWGANVIRLALYTAEYGGYCTGGDQDELKDLVKKGVEYASSEDMYVIIDWHILSEGSPSVYQSEAEAFFEEMSAEFAGYDNVLYEICNEPNGSADWNDIKNYAENIIPVIRSNDPDAVIIVGTPTWSQDVDKAAADPLTGYDNIMYTLHFYAATHKDDLRNKMISAVESGLPVFVTEYGICDASGSGGIDTESADEWVRVMDEYGISYCAWNISNKDETSAIFLTSVDKTSGFTTDDLSESGRWVYDMLQAALEVSSDDVSGGAAASENDQDSAAAAETGAASSGAGNPSSSSAGTLTNDDLDITVSISGSWESGGNSYYQYSVSIKNISGKAGSSWKITIDFDKDIHLSDSWNGTYSADGSTLTISGVSYNSSIPVGGEAGDIGFIVYCSGGLSVK